MNEWMNDWMDGWMDEWMKELKEMNEWNSWMDGNSTFESNILSLQGTKNIYLLKNDISKI